MTKRLFVSSIDVARESLRTGRVVVQIDRNRTENVQRAMAQARRDGNDNPFFAFAYGDLGLTFTVIVYERRRWSLDGDDGDEDGLSLMGRGSDGERWHKVARFSDLPPGVRAIAKDVRAILRNEDTRADKARAKRYAARAAKHRAWMETR